MPSGRQPLICWLSGPGRASTSASHLQGRPWPYAARPVTTQCKASFPSPPPSLQMERQQGAGKGRQAGAVYCFPRTLPTPVSFSPASVLTQQALQPLLPKSAGACEAGPGPVLSAASLCRFPGAQPVGHRLYFCRISFPALLFCRLSFFLFLCIYTIILFLYCHFNGKNVLFSANNEAIFIKLQIYRTVFPTEYSFLAFQQKDKSHKNQQALLFHFIYS